MCVGFFIICQCRSYRREQFSVIRNNGSCFINVKIIAEFFAECREYDNGPPQNNTGGVIVLPWASVTMVCTATAWNIEAAIFSLETFLAIKFCTSVLQNTPHREAIGYMRVDFWARFISLTSTPKITAIWSINAPVPPAQFPFMRKSFASAFSNMGHRTKRLMG